MTSQLILIKDDIYIPNVADEILRHRHKDIPAAASLQEVFKMLTHIRLSEECVCV